MAIRSEVVSPKETVRRRRSFPSLMVDDADGQIVLVIQDHEVSGLVKVIALTRVGEHQVGKEMTLTYDRLSDFTGTIQLSNE